ncbi:MAG: Fic family protein [Bacteroidaceae bacterium]|nr:Fic family protein [Bacteroidaceae bacterium]
MYINFDEYLRQDEPQMREKADAWRVAIGLQAVDGLKTSEYLQQTARRNIEGEITIDEARELVKEYYTKKTARDNDDADKEEADRVSSNISKLLQSNAFTYSVAGLAAIHRAIFEGVFKHAGRFRDFDISKREWVLQGDSVLYGRWQDLQMTIEYDLEQEHQFDYTNVSKDQMVEHLAKFVAGLWQIHPFGEGNTRTTAIFTIKYLRSQGFKVNNDLFESHSWYFRNALVRANYRNLEKGIGYEPIFLVRFFRNLLLGENNPLKNRLMLINSSEEWKATSSTPTSTPTSTPISFAKDSFLTNNAFIRNLVSVIGNKQCSIKDMMEGVGLKDRKNFMEYHLSPAISKGYVRFLYPDKPRHPRQKYLLTVKGNLLYKELAKID